MKNLVLKRSSMIFLSLVLVMSLLVVVPSINGTGGTSAFASGTDASGQVNASGGAYVRKGPSTSTAKVTLLKDNTNLTIMNETFVKTNSTKSTDRWYYVTANGKTGYIRSDLVDHIKFASASGKTTAAVNYRIGPSTSMTKKGTISNNKNVVVQLPAYMTNSRELWYRIQVGSKSFYMIATYVKLSNVEAPTDPGTSDSSDTSDDNSGTTEPGTTTTVGKVTTSGLSKPSKLYTGQSFTIKGTVNSTTNMTKIKVGIVDSNGNWVIEDTQNVNAKSFNLSKSDRNLKFGVVSAGDYNYRILVYFGSETVTALDAPFSIMRSEVAAKLLANPTNGGVARNVYTFNTSNCTKLFSVQGYGDAVVPQGMSFSGDTYHFVFGMSNAQSIVSYSASGKRLGAYKFPYNVSHPNGITWDPDTGLCYIFIGNQQLIHTWNPATGKFGKATTPYSSSGIGYDSSRDLLYSSSKSLIRVYSADGKFTHLRKFNRCSRGGTTYVQDCGSSNGFVFHGVSGANKHGTNYLDVYRVDDGKYLGSIIVNLDEIESVIVDNDGFVQLLINNKTRTDWVYKTPLNVNDLVS